MSKVKTNAIRLLDQKKISYELLTYEVDDQLDGITVATKINYPVEVVCNIVQHVIIKILNTASFFLLTEYFFKVM